MTKDLQTNDFEVAENFGRMVPFWWDPRDESWIPRGTTTNEFGSLEAVGHQFGSYVLLTEKDPPIIYSFQTGDCDDVP